MTPATPKPPKAKPAPAVDEAVAGASEPSVKSVDRAIRLLKAVASRPYTGAMFVELAKETGYGKATTHRLLSALAEGGLVFQDAATRKYRLGSAAMLMGRQAVTQQVAAATQASLDRLATETGDTAFASAPEGAVAVCVARAMGDFPIRSLTLDVGDRRPLGVGAGSLALLAAMTDGEIDRTLELNSRAYQAYPAFNAKVIRAMVAKTRKEGFAFNEGHVVKGMCAIGIPVLDASGRAVAALSMSAITDRMAAPRRKELVRLMAKEAQALSQRLSSPGA